MSVRVGNDLVETTVAQPIGTNQFLTIVDYIKQQLVEHPITSPEEILYDVDPIIKQETVSGIPYIGYPVYNIGCEYNYYTDYYEDIVKNENSILEPSLPNLYVHGDLKNKDTFLYKKIVTVGGQIDIEPQSTNNTYEYYDEFAGKYKKALHGLVGNPHISKFNELSVLQKKIYYTENILKKLPDINNNRNLLPYSNNISFGTNGPSVICAILENSGFMDQFCDFLTISSRVFTNFELNLLRETVVNEDGKINIVEATTQNAVDGLKFGDVPSFFNLITRFLRSNASSSILKLGLELPTTSFSGPNSSHMVSNMGYGRSVNTTPVEVKNNQKSTLYNFIKFKIFEKNFNTYIDSIKPKALELLKNSVTIPTEVIMYELVKTNKEDTEGLNPIQTFYFPNLNEITKIDFIDSQVKYGKEYNYILNSYNFTFSISVNSKILDMLTEKDWGLILQKLFEKYPEDVEYYLAVLRSKQSNVPFGYQATTYQETSSQQTQQTRQQIAPPTRSPKKSKKDFYGWKKPSNPTEKMEQFYLDHLLEIMIEMGYDLFIYQPMIFRDRLFNELAVVSDFPPPPPQVEIDGMMGVDNRIFLRFNSSIAEFKAKPQIIQESDIEIFNKNVIAQKLKDLEEPMYFDGDDRIQYFQIFKTDSHPYSYEDFKDKYFLVSTTFKNNKNDVDNETCDVLKANHSSYLDTIRPNQKYYYMFRSIDIHGNISNPTELYELEMINADGTIYPVIRVVEFKKKNLTTPAKSAKRFVHIMPNIMQTVFNEEQSGFYNENDEPIESAQIIKDRINLGLTEERVWNKQYRLKIRSRSTGKIVEVDFSFIYKTLSKDVVCE